MLQNKNIVAFPMHSSPAMHRNPRTPLSSPYQGAGSEQGMLVRPPECRLVVSSPAAHRPHSPSQLSLASANNQLCVREPTLPTEHSWQDFYSNLPQFIDNKYEEYMVVNPKAPDFKHRMSIDGWYTPGWVLDMLEKERAKKVGYHRTDVGKERSRHDGLEQDCGLVNEVGQFNYICNARPGSEVQLEASAEAQPQIISGPEMLGSRLEEASLKSEEVMNVFQAPQTQGSSCWEMLDLDEALNIFDQMGELPSMKNFICVLQKCRDRKSLEYAKRAHAHICNNRLEDHEAIGNYVVPMFVECGSVSDAQRVFDRLVHRNEHSWTSLILGYIRCGKLQHSLTLYQRMLEENVHPSNYTHVALLKACARLKDVERGRAIHVTVTLRGFERDLFVGSTLVNMYAECDSLSEAWEIFDKLSVRDVVTWNALITGYAEHGFGHEAFACFEQMQSECISPNAGTLTCILKACGSIRAIDSGRAIHMGIAVEKFTRDISVGNALVDMYAKCGSLTEAHTVFEKLPVRDVVSWTALIAGYAEHGPGHEALRCFEQMHLEDVSPNGFTFSCILKACCSVRDIEKGREIHTEIAQKGSDGDLYIGNTLVDMYAKCGSLLEAQEVSDKLLARDVASWTPLIAGYAELGPGQEALNHFEQMQHEGIFPDAITFACALKACSNIGAIDKGREVHMNITSMGFDKVPIVGNSLISMYAKCALLSEARAVFDGLPIKDIVAWSSMINGCGMNHDGHMAIQCFEDMQQQNVKPDAVTFTCLLTACSHAGLVLKGQEYFKVKREEYGIAPTREHYACMVDLFARSGHLYEAEMFLGALCPPAEGTWGALLTACKTYGEPELGRRCFEELVRMKPDVAAWYVLMSDIYAGAGRWDDAFEVEELRKHAGAKKKPASALIEVNKKVYEFVVGENHSSEISRMLRNLSSRMKDEGHVPHLDLVVRPVSDGEKELVLCEHAERLAIAFGFLHLPQGETLRVTKNLRMCVDCHSSSKVLSKMERREIILRDDSCIHHFKDGLCSCGDMF